MLIRLNKNTFREHVDSVEPSGENEHVDRRTGQPNISIVFLNGYLTGQWENYLVPVIWPAPWAAHLVDKLSSSSQAL